MKHGCDGNLSVFSFRKTTINNRQWLSFNGWDSHFSSRWLYTPAVNLEHTANSTSLDLATVWRRKEKNVTVTVGLGCTKTDWEDWEEKALQLQNCWEDTNLETLSRRTTKTVCECNTVLYNTNKINTLLAKFWQNWAAVQDSDYLCRLLSKSYHLPFDDLFSFVFSSKISRMNKTKPKHFYLSDDKRWPFSVHSFSWLNVNKTNKDSPLTI